MNHDIEKALDNLEKRAQDIQHYMNIMSKVKTVNVADDQDFQREFDFFYKVRRNAEWRKVFFEIFERKKKKNCSYKEIITELYEGTGQVEASFASKMLASIDENMPIWDSKVLDRIGIKSSNKRGQQKLEETIELYDVIVQWYSDLKANKASYNEYITSFDSRFPDYSSISDTKKIDFILWAMGEEEEDTIPSVYIQNMEALSDAAKIASRSIEAYPGAVSAVKQIADCKDVYVAYRKAGYSKAFFEAHREEITLHKAAKQAFSELGVEKLPTVKQLNEEYAELLARKKEAYREYRKAKQEMTDFATAKYDIERFLSL